MDSLLERLRHDYPDLQFIVGTTCCWSPDNKSIMYVLEPGLEATWSILHELGHAILNHQNYKTDVELLQKEVLAWGKAHELAQTYGIVINDEHVQNCLDSYRDWLDKRSTCPNCGVKTTAATARTYRCFNCHASWTVSLARHHRSYRRQIQKTAKSKPDSLLY